MIKKYLISRKTKKIQVRLDELLNKAIRLREGGASGSLSVYDDWYDYLTYPEQVEFSCLAMKHAVLLIDLGKQSTYFNPKRDFLKDEPNSPKGTLTVSHKTATIVDYRRDAEGLIWKYENGKRAEEFPVTNEFQGTTIEEDE